MSLAWVAVGAGGVGVLHVVARLTEMPRLAALTKPVPIGLLAVLVATASPVVGESYRWLLVAALLWSIAGDVLLLWPERFVHGLAAFLVAHLLYIAALAPNAALGGWAPLAAGSIAIVAGGVLRYLWPHLGRLRAPVAVYVGVVAVMGGTAVLRGLATDVPAPSGTLALVGAVVFMASDGLLAVDRFVHRIRNGQALVMSTYYGGQACLALSVIG